jgi:hypothetical protein
MKYSIVSADARERLMPVKKLTESKTAAHKALSHLQIITLSHWYLLVFFPK